MLPSNLSLTSHRGLLAAAVVTCFFAFATPATAGPLCVTEGVQGGTDVCRDFGVGDNAKYYLFDAGSGFDHLLRITVNEVLVPFGLRIVRELTPPGPINGFPDYNCVAYGPGNLCVEYKTRDVANAALEAHPVDEVDYNGPIIWLASWILPIGTNPIPEIFHDVGVDDGIYDELLTGIDFSAEQGPYDFNCDEPDNVDGANECSEEPPPPPDFTEVIGSFAKVGDPVRVSMSDSFSAVTVGQLAVPEPASMAFLAMIGAGWAVRSRRRNR